MLTMVALVIVGVFMAVELLLNTILVSAQQTGSVEQQQQQGGGSETTLHITKDATNTYAIRSTASFIDTFDTTYLIQGSVGSMNASKNLIISTIITDFDNSPTIGYIKTMTKQDSATSGTSIVNPFVNKETINEKIKNEIDTSIQNAVKSSIADGEVKCTFGMEVNDFKCSFHGLVGGESQLLPLSQVK
jgi:hypothetical protein